MRVSIVVAFLLCAVCTISPSLSQLESSSADVPSSIQGILFANGDIPPPSSFDVDDDDTPHAFVESVEEEFVPPKKNPSTADEEDEHEDEDVEQYLEDEDEFEGTHHIKKTTPSTNNGKKKQPKRDMNEPSIENVMAQPKTFFHPIGIWEFIGVGFIILYIINYFIGTRTNTKLAVSFSDHFRSVFEEQFAYIGTEAAPLSGPSAVAATGSDSSATNFTLEKESESTYKLYASGRRFCSGMLLTLNLQKRQDLISVALSQIDMAPREDTITLEIAMNDEDMDPFTFALVKKKLQKKFSKEFDPDNLMTLSKSSKASLDNYSVLNELPELENEILNDRVVRILTKAQVEKHFISAQFSDQIVLPWSSSKRVMKFTFRLPNEWFTGDDSPVDSFALLLKLAFHFIDRFGSRELSLNSTLQARIESRRKKLAEVALKASAKERQEAQLRRKEEQRRFEAELIAKDPTSEKAKELMRKKEAREAKMAKKARGQHIKVMR